MDKKAAGLGKDFVGGLDPMGFWTTDYAREAEHQGTSTAKHLLKGTTATVGGLIGGGLIVPSITMGVIGGIGAKKGRRLADALYALKMPIKDMVTGHRVLEMLRGVKGTNMRKVDKSLSAPMVEMAKRTPLWTVESGIQQARRQSVATGAKRKLKLDALTGDTAVVSYGDDVRGVVSTPAPNKVVYGLSTPNAHAGHSISGSHRATTMDMKGLQYQQSGNKNPEVWLNEEGAANAKEILQPIYNRARNALAMGGLVGGGGAAAQYYKGVQLAKEEKGSMEDLRSRIKSELGGEKKANLIFRHRDASTWGDSGLYQDLQGRRMGHPVVDFASGAIRAKRKSTKQLNRDIQDDIRSYSDIGRRAEHLARDGRRNEADDLWNIARDTGEVSTRGQLMGALGVGGVMLGGGLLTRAMKDRFSDPRLTHTIADEALDSKVVKSISRGASDFFRPSDLSIQISSNNPAILAHEVGHARNAAAYARLGRAGKALSALGMPLANVPLVGRVLPPYISNSSAAIIPLLPLLSGRLVRSLRGDDKDSLRYRAMDAVHDHPDVMVGAATLPFLAEEAAASARGVATVARHSAPAMRAKNILRALGTLAPAFATYLGAAGLGVLTAREIAKRHQRFDADAEKAEAIMGKHAGYSLAMVGKLPTPKTISLRPQGGTWLAGMSKGAAVDDDLVTEGLGAAATTSAAVPSAYKALQKARQVHLNPDGPIVIVTEGGKYNMGGAGHAAAARALEEEAVRRYGRDRVRVLNHNDMQVMRSEAVAKRMRQLLTEATDGTKTKLQRAPAGIQYAGGLALSRPQRYAEARKQLDGASRIIATNPDSVNYLRGMGIRPELVVTDYDIRPSEARKFWGMAYGTGIKDPDSLSRVFMPGQLSRSVFRGKAPVEDIGALPVDRKFSEAPLERLRELILNDTEGKELSRFALPEDKKIITVTGGSNANDVDKIVESLLESKRKDIHIVGLAGRNQKVYERLKALQDAGMPVSAQGFETRYADLLHRSDAVFARPHGLSATEALATGKPLVPVVTGREGKRLVDSYAGHMAGNAMHYSRVQGGIPVASLTQDGIRAHDDVIRALDDVLTNGARYAEGAKDFAGKIRGAASKVIDMPSTTRTVARDLPKPFRMAAMGIAGLAGVGALANALHSKTASDNADIAIAGGAMAGTAALPWRMNRRLIDGLKEFSQLSKARHLTDQEWINAYAGEGSRLINEPFVDTPGLRKLTLPWYDRMTNRFAKDEQFYDKFHRYHTRGFSRGPIAALQQLTYESQLPYEGRMFEMFADKARQMGIAVDKAEDVMTLPRETQLRLMSEDIGSEIDQLRKLPLEGMERSPDRMLRLRMMREPAAYGAKGHLLETIGRKARLGRNALAIGGLGLVGVAGLREYLSRN